MKPTAPGTRPTIEQPEQLAHDFLLVHWDGRLPIDPVKLATKVGVGVYGRGVNEDWPYVGYYNSANHTIEYNVTPAPEVQRMVIAHELGHYALKHVDTPHDVDIWTPDPIEVAATDFANALVMPRKLIRDVYNYNYTESTSDIAKVFGVTVNTINHRLLNLSY